MLVTTRKDYHVQLTDHEASLLHNMLAIVRDDYHDSQCHEIDFCNDLMSQLED